MACGSVRRIQPHGELKLPKLTHIIGVVWDALSVSSVQTAEPWKLEDQSQKSYAHQRTIFPLWKSIFTLFSCLHKSPYFPSSALSFRIEARINQQCRSSEIVLLFYIRLFWINGWKKMTLENSPFPWYFSFQYFKWMVFGRHILQSDKYSGIFRRHKEKCTSSTHKGKIQWPFLDLTLVTILKTDLKLVYLQGAKTTQKENR